jgi:tRNA(Ile)-lysidine synthase
MCRVGTIPASLTEALATVPAGAWVVGVSGGADSIALLALLRGRGDLHLTVAHLDHETRGGASALDAAFVRDLCERWGIARVIDTRGELEATAPNLPANPSARFRALRRELFRRVVASGDAHGVILAHHADDQAETILLRLLRGSGPAGLMGMAPCARVGGLTVVRPLLGVRRDALRGWLVEAGHAWREDESNASDAYARNRVRRLLGARPSLAATLLELGVACAAWQSWLRAAAPALGEAFDVEALRAVPGPVAREAARAWLVARGVDADETTAAAGRLVAMAADAASPARAHFPGGLLVRRRGGRIFVDDQAQSPG